MKQIEGVKAINYNKGTKKERIESVVKDETIILNINNIIHRSLSGIDDSLKEFAVGYLIGENMISSIKDIEDIKIDATEISIRINDTKLKNNEMVLCSDSGGGWRSKIENIIPVKSNFKISSIELIKKIEELKQNAEIWKSTGGTHVAAIVYKDQFIVKEDVSRHVAVDKVIGYGALNDFDFSQSYVIYSGRMPADMVIKLVRAGIPILASNAAPAYSGYKIAEKENITLVGFLRGERFNVYTTPQRVIFL